MAERKGLSRERRPSAAKLKEWEELKAMPKAPPEPTTIEEALAQCIEANQAWRRELAINAPSRTRRLIAHAIFHRREDAIANLFAIIDPDPPDDDDESNL
jgi:hypothetical protein